VRATPRLWEFYPGICLTTEEKHAKTSVRVAEECWYTYYQNAHVTKPIHTHPHITKQFKTTTVQMKETQYTIYQNETVTI